MRKVFDEAIIAGITLKNRVLRSATHEGMSDKTGKKLYFMIIGVELWKKP
jgi:2,4-dienoyl-CoA reductase-like NADH-dependent reductase (Old Yellow Enzyme family)